MSGKTRISFVFFSAALLLLAASAAARAGWLLCRMPGSSPPPRPLRLEQRLSKGKFLVASERIKDPRFMETVILLVEYDLNGAMGLIINRPTDMALANLFPDVKGLEQSAHPLYIGGPVASHQMLMLIRSGTRPGKASLVFDNIYVSSSSTLLEGMAGRLKEGEKFRVYAGYSGWAPGQLEGEISRGDWHILDADADTVFEKDPGEVWPELIRRGSGLHVRAGQL
jgi:putative transcriptional regulator